MLFTVSSSKKTNESGHNDLQNSSSCESIDESYAPLSQNVLFRELPEFYKKQFEDYVVPLNEQRIININMNNKDDFSWIADCKDLDWLTLNMSEDIDIEKLLYMSNLKNLSRLDINFACQLDYNKLIDLILHSNIKELCIKFERRGAFYKKDIDFINEILNSKTLYYFSFSGSHQDGFACEADFKKNLFTLTYPNDNFSNSTLRIPFGYENVLFSNGMRYQIRNNGKEADFLFHTSSSKIITNWRESNYKVFQESLAKLEKVYEKLDIDEKDSDKEKLKKILHYIVQNYAYDNKCYLNSAEKYYEDGRLKRALDSKEIICGNYSAIFQALANRAGLESYIIDGSLYGTQVRHSWNKVNIDGKYYLVDPTWIDNLYDTLNCLSGLVDEDLLLRIAYLINQDEYVLRQYKLREDFTKDIEHTSNFILPSINVLLFALMLDIFNSYKKNQEDNISKRHILQKRM